MRRSDHARIDPDRAIRADRLHRLRLEHAQQLRLHGQRQLAELVEKQRAAGRLDERARAIAIGARERTAHVTEHVRVDQVLGDRAAVDHHERPRRACGRVVDRARRELLAGPRFALDEHRRLARCRHLEHREQLAHCDTSPRHLAEVISIARWERRRIRGGDPYRCRSELDGGTCRDHDLDDAVPLKPRTVRRSEVLDPDPLGRDRELCMFARHLRIRQHELAGRVRSDRDGTRPQRDRRHLVAQHLQAVRTGRGATACAGRRKSRLDQRAPIESHDQRIRENDE